MRIETIGSKVALFLAVAMLASAAERDIAEWAIRRGGRVILEGSRAPYSDMLSLPPGEIHITGIDLVGTLINADELEQISTLTDLKELHLPGPSWNPASGSRLDANAQLKFIAGLKNLEKLSFSLHFLTNVNVQDKGIDLLTGVTNLREFRCTQCRLAKVNLSKFPKLESLDLSLSTFNDEGMKSVAELTQLRRLSLRDSLVTEKGLSNLARLTKIEELDLGGTHVSDAGLAHLANLKSLRKLNLLGAELSDASVDTLAGMTQLRELNLYRSQITNAGLARLAALKDLTELDLRYSRVTASGLQTFRAALPKCKVEFVGTATVEAKAVGKPAGSGDAAIAEWVKKLGGKIEEQGGRIRSVSLAATRVNDADAPYLGSLVRLEKLDLGHHHRGAAVSAPQHICNE